MLTCSFLPTRALAPLLASPSNLCLTLAAQVEVLPTPTEECYHDGLLLYRTLLHFHSETRITVFSYPDQQSYLIASRHSGP